MDGGEIVQARRGEEITLKADNLCFLRAVNVKLKGENLLRAYAELFRKLSEQIAVFPPTALYRAAKREQVDVRLQRDALVDLAVHVNGKIRDGEQRLVPRNEALFGTHGVVRAYEGNARERKRTVKPCVVDGTAVRLDGELAAAAGEQLRLRLDAKTGPIGMCSRNTEEVGVLAYRKGCQKSAVLDKIAAAARKLKCIAERKGGKSLRGQQLRRFPHSMIRRNAAIQKTAQIGQIFRHRYRSFSFAQAESFAWTCLPPFRRKA